MAQISNIKSSSSENQLPSANSTTADHNPSTTPLPVLEDDAANTAQSKTFKFLSSLLYGVQRVIVSIALRYILVLFLLRKAVVRFHKRLALINLYCLEATVFAAFGILKLVNVLFEYWFLALGVSVVDAEEADGEDEAKQSKTKTSSKIKNLSFGFLNLLFWSNLQIPLSEPLKRLENFDNLIREKETLTQFVSKEFYVLDNQDLGVKTPGGNKLVIKDVESAQSSQSVTPSGHSTTPKDRRHSRVSRLIRKRSQNNTLRLAKNHANINAVAKYDLINENAKNGGSSGAKLWHGLSSKKHNHHYRRHPKSKSSPILQNGVSSQENQGDHGDLYPYSLKVVDVNSRSLRHNVGHPQSAFSPITDTIRLSDDEVNDQ